MKALSSILLVRKILGSLLLGVGYGLSPDKIQGSLLKKESRKVLFHHRKASHNVSLRGMGRFIRQNLRNKKNGKGFQLEEQRGNGCNGDQTGLLTEEQGQVA